MDKNVTWKFIQTFDVPSQCNPCMGECSPMKLTKIYSQIPQCYQRGTNPINLSSNLKINPKILQSLKGYAKYRQKKKKKKTTSSPKCKNDENALLDG